MFDTPQLSAVTPVLNQKCLHSTTEQKKNQTLPNELNMPQLSVGNWK